MLKMVSRSQLESIEMTTRQTAKADAAAPNAISPGALARRWDCCRQTIYNMINDDELRSFKVRNRRLIPLTEVERVERGD